MPNFELSDDDARDISAFLIANSTRLSADAANVSANTSADPAAGASLYGESFCASCHAVQNAAGNMVGGDARPELTRIGTKVKPEWLQAWLRNPRVYNPVTGMPHYRFSDGQATILAGFLQGKADSDFLANVHLDAATPEQVAHGKRLVSDFGCASCHEIAGIRRPENFAPELSRIGSKPITQLIFLPGMQHTLPDYIAGKIKNPRAFSPGLKMPQYTFTPQQIDALTTELLSLNERSYSLPHSLAVPGVVETDAEQTQRCRFDCNHHQWRPGSAEICADARLGEYAQQVRHTGSDRIYPCSFGSALEELRTALLRERSLDNHIMRQVRFDEASEANTVH
jgi:cytochrome c2